MLPHRQDDDDNDLSTAEVRQLAEEVPQLMLLRARQQQGVDTILHDFRRHEAGVVRIHTTTSVLRRAVCEKLSQWYLGSCKLIRQVEFEMVPYVEYQPSCK